MKLKQGDKRKDGMIFWQYGSKYKNGERWVTQSAFNKYKLQQSATDKRPQKRELKRGDIRKDGKIFWCYANNCKNGERWITSEKFKQMADGNIPNKKKLKRGDTRSKDEMVFWGYNKSCKNGELWISKEKFIEYNNKDNRPKSRNLKKGDIRSDGMVFMKYHKRCKNGEYWVSAEKYSKEIEKDKASKRDRTKTKKYKDVRNKRQRSRKRSDPHFKVMCNLRARLSSVISRYSKAKKVSHIKDIGCDFHYFIKYIESQFNSGMTWQNYGKLWHIDHIRPCASFDLSKKSDQLAMCHYTNLQPMLAIENMKKGDKFG